MAVVSPIDLIFIYLLEWEAIGGIGGHNWTRRLDWRGGDSREMSPTKDICDNQ